MSSVLGKLRAMEAPTDSPDKSERERSPCSTFPSQLKYLHQKRLVETVDLADLCNSRIEMHCLRASVTAMSPGTSFSNENSHESREQDHRQRLQQAAADHLFAGLRRAIP